MTVYYDWLKKFRRYINLYYSPKTTEFIPEKTELSCSIVHRIPLVSFPDHSCPASVCLFVIFFFIFNFLSRTTESISLNLAKGFQVYPNVFNTGTPQFTNLIKTSSVLLLMNPWLHRSVYNKISYLLSSVLIFHTFLHRCTLQS